MKKIKEFLIKILGGYKILMVIGEENGQRFTSFYGNLYPAVRNIFKFKNIFIQIDPDGSIKVERKY